MRRLTRKEFELLGWKFCEDIGPRGTFCHVEGDEVGNALIAAIENAPNFDEALDQALRDAAARRTRGTQIGKLNPVEILDQVNRNRR